MNILTFDINIVAIITALVGTGVITGYATWSYQENFVKSPSVLHCIMFFTCDKAYQLVVCNRKYQLLAQNIVGSEMESSEREKFEKSVVPIENNEFKIELISIECTGIGVKTRIGVFIKKHNIKLMIDAQTFYRVDGTVLENATYYFCGENYENPKILFTPIGTLRY